MDYLQNHCWCSDSNWGGHYDCRHIVTIKCYDEYEYDWNQVIDESAEEWFDEEAFNRMKSYFLEKGHDEDMLKGAFVKEVPNLRQDILSWLAENVADRKDPECEKGWCIGSNDYRSSEVTSFSVFFHRRKDAMAFIRNFSQYKKPVHYCQYFSDVRKKLNIETMKYEEA